MGPRATKPLVAILAAAVAIAAAGGCGGGGRTVAASSMSAAEYARRADAICAKGRLRGLRYQPGLAAGQTNKAASAAIEASVLPAVREVVDRLYALGAPSGRKAGIEAFLAAFQQAVDEGEQMEVPTFERLERVLAKPGGLAVKNGLTACAYG